jgi:hypothetical protein
MQPILNLHTWVSLPNDVRHKIRGIFSIPRSESVFVNDGVIETDGTTPQDFKVLTVEKMQSFLSSEETDFNKLFDLVVARVVDEIEGKPVVEEVKPIINANPIENVKKANKKSK